MEDEQKRKTKKSRDIQKCKNTKIVKIKKIKCRRFKQESRIEEENNVACD